VRGRLEHVHEGLDAEDEEGGARADGEHGDVRGDEEQVLVWGARQGHGAEGV